MNYLDYICTIKKYVDSLKEYKIINMVESIYLVRGFAKTDITIGRSDIDIIVILNRNYEEELKKKLRIFGDVYKKISGSNNILSSPKLVFPDEFLNKFYYHSCSWGIPLHLESELVFGKNQVRKQYFDHINIKTALYSELLLQMTRSFFWQTSNLFKNNFFIFHTKLERRIYFAYIWLKYGMYIISQQDIYNFLSNTPLIQNKFLKLQITNELRPMDSNFFFEMIKFYKHLINQIPLNEIAKNNKVKYSIIEELDLLKDRKILSKLRYNLSFKGGEIYFYREWRDSWCKSKSSQNKCYLFFVIKDLNFKELQNIIKSIKNYYKKIIRIVKFDYLGIIPESIFIKFISYNLPITGAYFNCLDPMDKIFKGDIKKGIAKNIVYSYYNYKKDYCSRLFFVPKTINEFNDPVYKLCSLLSDILFLKDNLLIFYPLNVFKEFISRYPDYLMLKDKEFELITNLLSQKKQISFSENIYPFINEIIFNCIYNNELKFENCLEREKIQSPRLLSTNLFKKTTFQKFCS